MKSGSRCDTQHEAHSLPHAPQKFCSPSCPFLRDACPRPPLLFFSLAAAAAAAATAAAAPLWPKAPCTGRQEQYMGSAFDVMHMGSACDVIQMFRDQAWMLSSLAAAICLYLGYLAKASDMTPGVVLWERLRESLWEAHDCSTLCEASRSSCAVVPLTMHFSPWHIQQCPRYRCVCSQLMVLRADIEPKTCPDADPI